MLGRFDVCSLLQLGVLIMGLVVLRERCLARAQHGKAQNKEHNRKHPKHSKGKHLVLLLGSVLPCKLLVYFQVGSKLFACLVTGIALKLGALRDDDVCEALAYPLVLFAHVGQRELDRRRLAAK